MIKIIGNKRYNSEVGRAIAEQVVYEDGQVVGKTYILLTPKNNVFKYRKITGPAKTKSDIFIDDMSLDGFDLLDPVEIQKQFNIEDA